MKLCHLVSKSYRSCRYSLFLYLGVTKLSLFSFNGQQLSRYTNWRNGDWNQSRRLYISFYLTGPNWDYFRFVGSGLPAIFKLPCLDMKLCDWNFFSEITYVFFFYLMGSKVGWLSLYRQCFIRAFFKFGQSTLPVTKVPEVSEFVFSIPERQTWASYCSTGNGSKIEQCPL